MPNYKHLLKRLNAETNSESTKNLPASTKNPQALSMDLQAPGNVIPIPSPTADDIKIAKKWKSYNIPKQASLLFGFCREDRLWAIQYALRETPSLIHANSDQPLHMAVRKNYHTTVILLHANGADLDSRKGYALRLTSEKKNKDLALLLVKLGASVPLAMESDDDQRIKDYLKRLFYKGKTLYEKQDNDRILRTRFMINDPDVITCYTEFNFRARKITTTLEKGTKITPPVIEYFRDQETPHEIQEARDALIKQDGNPDIGTTHKPSTALKSVPHRPK